MPIYVVSLENAFQVDLNEREKNLDLLLDYGLKLLKINGSSLLPTSSFSIQSQTLISQESLDSILTCLQRALYTHQNQIVIFFLYKIAN